MKGLLLDTHVLIWLAEKDSKLGKQARALIAKAYAAQSVQVSAISFWEVGMLVAKERVRLKRPVDSWRADVLKAGIGEAPISGEIGVFATQLDWAHQDPADRLIAATALLGHFRLVTADRTLLTWKGGPQCIDARL